MKRRMFLVSMLLTGMLVSIPGCNLSSDDVQNITTGVVKLGMTTWAQKNPDKAKEVADLALKSTDDALDYLNNNTGIATTVLNAVILAKLTQGLPAEVQDLIEQAAGVLDDVLPEPSPDTYLTPAQLAYLKGFIQGIKNGVKVVGTKDIMNAKDLAKVQKAQKFQVL